MGHLSLLELMAACGHFSPLLSLQSWEWEERREKERGEERRMGEDFSVCKIATRIGIKNESSARWLRGRALKCHWSGKSQL